MATASMVDDMLKVLECPICLSTIKNPRRLACDHSFCKTCLDRLIEFNYGGSCTILCPKQCAIETDFSREMTTNDLGVDYMMKGLLDVIAEYNKKSTQPVEKKFPCQGSINCNKNISHYCRSCDIFFCQSCSCHHEKDKYVPVTASNDDEEISVLCEEHATRANYLCCEPCPNKFICMYCRHRDHYDHLFDNIEKLSVKIKDDLHKGIVNATDFNEIVCKKLQKTEEDISIAKEFFKKTISYRKLSCMRDYSHFLDEEEHRLNMKFEDVLKDCRDQFQSKDICMERYEKITSRDGIAFIIQAIDYLGTCIDNRNKMELMAKTISLSDTAFDSDHPLGDILVNDEINGHSGNKYFKFKVNDTEIGNENVQKLTKETFPRIEETTNYLMQEIERLRIDLLKLDNQDFHLTQKMKMAFQPKYVVTPKQAGQSCLLHTNIEGQSFSYQLPYVSQPASFPPPLFQQPVKRPLQPAAWGYHHQHVRSYKGIRRSGAPSHPPPPPPGLHQMHRPTWHPLQQRPVLSSGSVSSSPVRPSMAYKLTSMGKNRTPHKVKPPVVRTNQNMQGEIEQPLTASLLNGYSLSDQKQMIGERLFPLVQEHQPHLAGKITGMLLEIDNTELLQILGSDDLLVAKVEEAKRVLDVHEAKHITEDTF